MSLKKCFEELNHNDKRSLVQCDCTLMSQTSYVICVWHSIQENLQYRPLFMKGTPALFYQSFPFPFSSLTNCVIKETYKCTWKKKHLLLWCTVHRLDHCRTSASFIISCNEIFFIFYFFSPLRLCRCCCHHAFLFVGFNITATRFSKLFTERALSHFIQHIFTSPGKGFISLFI